MALVVIGKNLILFIYEFSIREIFFFSKKNVIVCDACSIGLPLKKQQNNVCLILVCFLIHEREKENLNSSK